MRNITKYCTLYLLYRGDSFEYVYQNKIVD